MNMKIDTSKWERFNLYNELLFTIDSGNKFDKSKMSFIEPNVNFVGRSGVNNGVTCFVDNVKGIEPYEAGFMTLALGGEIGACFIQEKDFYTSQNVNVLIPNWNMSYFIKKFISLMIFKESKMYYKAFENELNRHLKTDFSILLPTIQSGVPDWKYIEEYMQFIEDKSTLRLHDLSSIKGNQTKIVIDKFNKITVEKLFEINPTSYYKMTNVLLLDDGSNPVLSNSAYNNGVCGYSSQPTTENGNIITFSDTVDANTIFYQENAFVGYSHVQGLYPIGEYSSKWTKYSLLYFASVFKATAKMKGFDYGNKFRRDIASKLEILLPVNSEGKIDFEYMENYMKSIEHIAQNRIDKFKSLLK